MSKMVEMLEDVMMRGIAESYQRSWTRQTREHRDRRLDLLLRMVSEKNKILAVTTQSTAWCDTAIDELVVGDVEALRSIAKLMDFESEIHRTQSGARRERDREDDYNRQMHALYAGFRALCDEALTALEGEIKEAQEREAAAQPVTSNPQ